LRGSQVYRALTDVLNTARTTHAHHTSDCSPHDSDSTAAQRCLYREGAVTGPRDVTDGSGAVCFDLPLKPRYNTSSMPWVAENIRRLSVAIADACTRAGRDPRAVTLVAVSKGVPAEIIRQRVAEGFVVIPKNINHAFTAMGVGKGLKAKINANIGTSPSHFDIDEELGKLDVSALANGVVEEAIVGAEFLFCFIF